MRMSIFGGLEGGAQQTDRVSLPDEPSENNPLSVS